MHNYDLCKSMKMRNGSIEINTLNSNEIDDEHFETRTELTVHLFCLLNGLSK